MLSDEALDPGWMERRADIDNGHAGLGAAEPVVAARDPFDAAPIRAAGKRGGAHAKPVSLNLTGLSIAAVILAVPIVIAVLPQAVPLVYAAWMMPCLELALMAVGAVWYRHRFRENESRFSGVIMQVTTAGREPRRVQEITDQVRGYHLGMPLAIWVVTEPTDRASYPGADLVLRVPPSFRCQARRKGRALEYSRRVRSEFGLDRPDVKIILNDDDVTPTRAYIETAFRADYDVCEGIVTPRTGYGLRPFGHFLASHADDIRTHACLVYCSVFQGILRRPLHVHGEGLVITGEAERVVGWDRDCMSEDLSFGQTACKAGLRWGWFHEYVEITSPWTLREYLIQRRRWLWGDIHAIRSRSLMGWGAATRVCLKYALSVVALACSAVGLWLRLSGRIPATVGILNFGKLAMIAWVALFFSCGWIAASSAHQRRSDDSRMIAGVTAVLLMPVSVLLTVAAILIPLAQGDPGDFMTIRKTR
jgi:Glycosyl transferase family group 2